MNNDRDFSVEIVKAIESGINKHLDVSVIYSPFKMFYLLFKKANPALIDQIRGKVRNDIYNKLVQIPGFQFEIFLNNNEITSKGGQLLKISYNIGIHILKKQLTVITAFKAITNAHVRNQTYNYILSVVERSASRVLHHE